MELLIAIIGTIFIPFMGLVLKVLFQILKDVSLIKGVLFNDKGKKNIYTMSELDHKFEIHTDQLKNHRSELQKIEENQKSMKIDIHNIKEKMWEGEEELT